MSGKERPAAIIKDMAHTGKRRVRSKDWVPIVFFLLVSLVLFPVVLPQVACVGVTDVVESLRAVASVGLIRCLQCH